LILALVFGLAAAACATADEQDAAATADAVAATPSAPPEWPWDLAEAGVDVPASVPLDEIRSGGPPPDGIPPIDDPVFESVA